MAFPCSELLSELEVMEDTIANCAGDGGGMKGEGGEKEMDGGTGNDSSAVVGGGEEERSSSLMFQNIPCLTCGSNCFIKSETTTEVEDGEVTLLTGSECLVRFCQLLKIKPGSGWGLDNLERKEGAGAPFCNRCRRQLTTLFDLEKTLRELEEAFQNEMMEFRKVCQEAEGTFEMNGVYDKDQRYYKFRRQIVRVARGRRSARTKTNEAKKVKVKEEINPGAGEDDDPDPDYSQEEGPTKKRSLRKSNRSNCRSALSSVSPVVLVSADEKETADQYRLTKTEVVSDEDDVDGGQYDPLSLSPMMNLMEDDDDVTPQQNEMKKRKNAKSKTSTKSNRKKKSQARAKILNPRRPSQLKRKKPEERIYGDIGSEPEVEALNRKRGRRNGPESDFVGHPENAEEEHNDEGFQLDSLFPPMTFESAEASLLGVGDNDTSASTSRPPPRKRKPTQIKSKLVIDDLSSESEDEVMNSEAEDPDFQLDNDKTGSLFLEEDDELSEDDPDWDDAAEEATISSNELAHQDPSTGLYSLLHVKFKPLDDGGSETLECLECSRTVKKVYIGRHYHRYHSSRFKCPKPNCGKLLASAGNLSKHLRLRHAPGKVKRIPQVLKTDCPICGKPCRPGRLLQSHLSTHYSEQDKADAIARGEPILTYADLSIYQCDHCGKRFRAKKYLERHIRGAHAKSDNDDGGEADSSSSLGKELCPECGVLVHKHYLRKHRLRAHRIGEDGRPSEEAPVEKTKRFICSYCDKRFHEHKQLLSHRQRIHEKIFPFKCDLCPRSFSTEQQIKRHMNTHNNIRPYQCAHCPMAFFSASNLKRHVGIYHGEGANPKRKQFLRGVVTGKTSCPHYWRKSNNDGGPPSSGPNALDMSIASHAAPFASNDDTSSQDGHQFF